MCCVELEVEFGSDEFIGSESSGHVEVVVIITGGSSTTPIDVKVNPKQIKMSAKGVKCCTYSNNKDLMITVLW